MSITVGMKGRAETVVTPENTAAAVGSGLVPVFATPSMIALMENAAVNAVQAQLEEGQGTVGTLLMKVWAEAEVTAVEGRKLTYTVAAFDEAGPIGKGEHQRFMIQADRFLAKAEAKKEGK